MRWSRLCDDACSFVLNGSFTAVRRVERTRWEWDDLVWHRHWTEKIWTSSQISVVLFVVDKGISSCTVNQKELVNRTGNFSVAINVFLLLFSLFWKLSFFLQVAGYFDAFMLHHKDENMWDKIAAHLAQFAGETRSKSVLVVEFRSYLKSNKLSFSDDEVTLFGSSSVVF